jgi:predicted anti-sigma-YlaC factor YlaD
VSALPRSVVCERVREQVSLLLDGELSELEARMVESHVLRCADCAEYRADVTTFTEALRDAPFEVLRTPVVVERRRAVSIVRIQVGVAAALALAALGLGTQLQARPSSSQSIGSITRFPSDAEVASEAALLRLVRFGDPSNRSAAPL